MKGFGINTIELQNEYLQEGITMSLLAEKYHCCETTINNYLKLIYNEKVLKKIRHYGKKAKISTCNIEGCDKRAKFNGRCTEHYLKIETEKYTKDKVVINSKNIIYSKKTYRNINIYINCLNYIKIIIYNKVSDNYVEAEISNECFERVKNHMWRFRSDAYIGCKIDKKRSTAS
ncbi:hypothetical protein [Clostridium sp.]|uniref:hypothetical protein n=1 Tax=Clostridium sp. TaxID=1506 RepID=UPI001A3A753B|nr:hypothetical protein [Clostridium sp.]MBK5242132.1 hypothetical protein [Clostridium sp.]